MKNKKINDLSKLKELLTEPPAGVSVDEELLDLEITRKKLKSLKGVGLTSAPPKNRKNQNQK